MKKILSILFSVLFSIFILIIGAGINVIKCNHSGKYKISLAVAEFDNGFSCNPAHGCMEKDFYKFAPDATLDNQNIDFQSFNAIITIIFEIPVIENFFSKSILGRSTNNVIPPPKEIYKIIRVFRI